MRKVCLCYCHDTDEVLNDDGVDVGNAIDAAIACPLCRNMHCEALLHPAPAELRKPGHGPRIVERTPEERAEAWELYLRERQRKNQC